MTSVEPRDRFVTHAEFRQFREHIDGQFSDIKMVLQGLAAGQTDAAKANRTNWGVLAAWAGVIVTIGALVATPMWGRIEELEANLDAHRDLDGHPAAIERHLRTGDAIDALRTEIRDVKSQIRQLDDRIRPMTATASQSPPARP